MRARTLSNTFSLALICTASSMAFGCGSDSGGDGNSTDPVSACGSTDRYLPFEAGNSWSYRVFINGTPEVRMKSQTLTADTDAELGEVLVQRTVKRNGSIVNMFQVEGDAVMRKKQQERDATGALESTTTYLPGKLRIDESSDRLVPGAAWDEVYEEVVTDGSGAELSRGSTTDHWEVLGVDVDCSSPLGDFKCLHLHRQRTVGGISDKQYFFAKGIGKIREEEVDAEVDADEPIRVEELVSCW